MLTVTDNSEDEHGTQGSALVKGMLVGIPSKAHGRGLVANIGSLVIIDLETFDSIGVSPSTFYPEYDGELSIENEVDGQ